MLDIAPVFLGIFLAQVSPGPNMMAVSSASLGSGRAPGIATAAGIATGVFLWATLFASGVGALLDAFPQAITAMRFIGGGYLIYLGLKAVRAALTRSPGGRVAASVRTGGRAAYLRGLLVVLTNPKAALMWVAISMYLASSGLSVLGFLAIGLGASASAMVIYGTYALLFSTGIVMRAYARFFRAIEGSFGLVFGAIGAKLVVDGVKELRA
ncbi:LysE family translocator [Microvirga lenta]|uniref:LysE family translocator n=1 Tax=Microvirga lenta TaxID=2881337 RepID=UPI001CFF7EC7|nr:LysE family translocator [Microvirga lenta]MCB5176586.1 LysE family translocator [Microvirga lenta]